MSKVPSWLESARIYQMCPRAFADREALIRVQQWFSHISEMNCNTLALTSVWQCSSDHQDTRDFATIDARLGSSDQFKQFVSAAHAAGLRVVVDVQFNFVGRDFFAVQDLLSAREASRYLDWFMRIQFDGDNHYRDGLIYERWEDQSHLVQLNTAQPDVQRYFLNQLESWVSEFNIDGIRLLSAEALDSHFVQALRSQCDSYQDFWLNAEVLEDRADHWLGDDSVHSQTNYPLFKALWSSLNSNNLYELDYCLSRQFGHRAGLDGRRLQTFLDGPELSRIASRLKLESQLFPLYLLLYLIPGVPTLYYGSEWRARGVTNRHGNDHLRPNEARMVELSQTEQDLKNAIVRFAGLRAQLPELSAARFRSHEVKNDFIAFERGDNLLCLINASHSTLRYELTPGLYEDFLNHEQLHLHGHVNVPPMWGRVLRRKVLTAK